MAERAQRNCVRWLLRALAEPAFLRLYLDRRRPAFRAFEDAFFSLAPDAERPKDDRRDAWKQLEAWVNPESTPAGWFRDVLKGLRGDAHAEQTRDLGRFWALGELFDDGAEEPAEPGTYHEIHCHLRGGVPYLALWRGFIESDRKRAALRRYPCDAGNWRRTWAELVADATSFRESCHPWVAYPDAGWDEAQYLRTLVRQILGAGPAGPAEPAVRYLATCAGLSSFLLHQRGTPGLSHFVDSYDRYSKVQKIRGSPGRQQTRVLVADTLRRFERDGVAAVELRPTLDRRRRDLQRKLQDVVLGYFDYLYASPANRPLAMGLVPSLFKQEGLRKGEPSEPAFWEDQQEIWADQVRMLLAILDESPALRWFVVGLDAAGKERGCPPRALRPAFGLVRAYNRGRALAHPGRRMSTGFLRALRVESKDSDGALDALDKRHVQPIRLGITVHAGEDFEEPLTGLRHIWETAVDLNLGEGDRLGHALAAGLNEVSVRTLLERRAKGPGGEVERLGPACFAVRKPRGTHLLDLAWICRVGGPGDVREAKVRLGEVASRAFGAPADAVHLARELRRPGSLVRLALPATRFGDPRDLRAHHQEAVIVDAAWLALIEHLRENVLHELVRRKVVVESCPTSNWVVANLDEPPLLTLAKKDGLRLALATDDPGVLGVFPRAELGRFDRPCQDRLLAATERASFVTRADKSG